MLCGPRHPRAPSGTHGNTQRGGRRGRGAELHPNAVLTQSLAGLQTPGAQPQRRL